jgi:hypothetical protein
MPNPRKRDKKIPSHFPKEGRIGAPKARSVKDLLNRASPVLAPISQQVVRQHDWRRWLETRLPPLVAARMTGVVERDDVLVIFTESAAWSVRLRYAVADIEPELKMSFPEISRITVRVMPRTKTAKSSRSP